MAHLDKTQQAAGTSMAKAQRSAAMQAGRLTKRLETQLATAGQSSRQARIYKLAQDGAKQSVIDHLRALDRQLEKQERQADAMRRGARITEQAMSPLQRYQREQRDLSDLLQRGAISQQVYRRSVRASMAQLSAGDRNLIRFGNRLGWLVNEAQRAGRGVRGMAGSSLRAIRRLTTGFGGLLALIGGGSIGYMVGRQFGEIDKIAKFSAEVGFTTAELAGFQHGAGLTGTSVEHLNKGLQRFTRRVGEAKLGVGEGLKGIERLGLDANELANMDAGQAFRRVAQGIKELPGPAERAAVAYSLFGRQGQELMNFLMAGEDGINSFVKEADKLGLTFSTEDAARVEMANDAIHRLQGLVTGAARALAIHMAPWITAVTDKLTGAGMAGEGMGQRVLNGMAWALRGVAKLADGVNMLLLGFKAARYGVTRAISWITKQVFKLRSHFVDAIDAILLKAASLAEKIPGVGDDIAKALRSAVDFNHAFQEAGETFAADLTAEADKLGRELEDAWLAPSYGDQLTNWFEDVQARADAAAAEIAAGAGSLGHATDGAQDFAAAMEQAEKNARTVTERLTQLQESVTTFNFDDTAMLRYELEQLGATPEQVEQAVKLQTQLEGFEAGQKAADDMARAAEQTFESTRTPLEKYEQKLDDLNDLLNAGAIDWDTYGRAIRDAREQLERTADAAAKGTNDALLAGTAAAHLVRFERIQSATRTELSAADVALADSGLQIEIAPSEFVAQLPQKPVHADLALNALRDDLGKEQLSEAKEQTRALTSIERNTRPSNTAATTSIQVVEII